METLEQIIKRILSKHYPEKIVEKKLRIHLEIKPKSNNLAKLISKHGPEEAERKFADRIAKDKKKGTLAGYIERYGETDGPVKYYEKNSRLSVGVDSLRRNGHSEEEIEEIRNKHSTKSAITLENMILRYGEEDGTLRFNKWRADAVLRSVRRVEFWTNRGFTLEEAQNEVSRVQTRDLSFFIDKGWTEEEYADLCRRRGHCFTKEGYIERFGEIEGPIRFSYDRAKGSNLEYLIEKHGEEEGKRKLADILEKRSVYIKNSKAQIELAKAVYDKLPPNIQERFFGEPVRSGYWIAYKPNEFGIQYSIPDIRVRNILVEYDGTYWHSSEQAKQRDMEKDILNSRLGYLTIRISEIEYREEPESSVDKVVRFILENISFEFQHTFKRNQ